MIRVLRHSSIYGEGSFQITAARLSRAGAKYLWSRAGN